MTLLALPKKDPEFHVPHSLQLTDEQFTRLARYLELNVKIRAVSAINTKTKTDKEKSIWILNTAEYGQREIAKMLHVSRNTVKAVLEGKQMKEVESEID